MNALYKDDAVMAEAIRNSSLGTSEIVDAILAAGYSKPRTITTVEELDALPDGSVVLDPIGISLHKNEFVGWRASNGAKNVTAEMLAHEALPATVLYTPKES